MPGFVWTGPKGDVTRDDSQQRFLAQNGVATLLTTLGGMVTTLFQHCNAMLR